mgnify:CR=1 FL=1
MYCSVFRSSRKAFTYLYLHPERLIEDLPESLLKAFGEPIHVLDLELTPRRKLATENVKTVIGNLRTQGYHLQLPPGDELPDELRG